MNARFDVPARFSGRKKRSLISVLSRFGVQKRDKKWRETAF